MQKIKIYLDSGADITGIKSLHEQCIFFNAPYDSPDQGNRRDAMRLDSAYKEGVHRFLTSDKKDIWTHRHFLEGLLAFKIFHPLPNSKNYALSLEGAHE